jgi:8-oxo-dGTP diphosphatase
MTQLYSCGLIFDEPKQNVMLIQKRRPKWQEGLFNGIGGHVEEGETPLECMYREAKEESTISSKAFWKYLAVYKTSTFEVHFFYTPDHDLNMIRPLTDEQLHVFAIKDLFNPSYYFYNNLAPNIRLLIELAMNNNDLKLPVILEG